MISYIFLLHFKNEKDPISSNPLFRCHHIFTRARRSIPSRHRTSRILFCPWVSRFASSRIRQRRKYLKKKSEKSTLNHIIFAVAAVVTRRCVRSDFETRDLRKPDRPRERERAIDQSLTTPLLSPLPAAFKNAKKKEEGGVAFSTCVHQSTPHIHRPETQLERMKSVSYFSHPEIFLCNLKIGIL